MVFGDEGAAGRDLVALRPLTVFAAPPPDVRKCLRPSERRPPKLLGLRPAPPFDAINIDHQHMGRSPKINSVAIGRSRPSAHRAAKPRDCHTPKANLL